MNTKLLYNVRQKNLILSGSILVIIGSFLPWEIEGDFISAWRYGIQIFPVFADHGGILVLLLSIFIIGLVFRSEGFVKSPTKWVLRVAIALFIIFAYHIIDLLIRHIAANRIVGAPTIKFGLILVGLGSLLLSVTAFSVNFKTSANNVQKQARPQGFLWKAR